MSARCSPSISIPSTLSLATALAVVLISCTPRTDRSGTAPTPTDPARAQPPGGAAPQSSPSPASKPAAGDATVKPAVEATGPSSSAGWPSPLTDETASRLWAEIQTVYNSIPTTFTGYKGDLDELAQRVKTCGWRVETFLSMYPGTDQACQGRGMLGKLRYYLRDRYRRELTKVRLLAAEEVERQMREYNDGIVKLATEALGCLPSDRLSWRADAHKSAADSEFHSGNFEAALTHYRKILELQPEFPDRNNVIAGAGRCLTELERYVEGVEFIRKAIQTDADGGYLPFFYQLLWKLHLSAGDRDKMISICDEIEEVGRKRMALEGIDERALQAWIRYRGFGGFRKGLAILGDGRPGDALDAFNRALALMDELRSFLGARGKGFPPELNVYLQRIHTYINYITQRHSETPASDLGTIHWASGNRVLLGENLGKTVLIVFRAYDDKRQKDFLQAVDAHVAEHPDRLRMASVSYMQGTTRPAAEQAQQALAEAMDLRLRSCAIGIDPSKGGTVLRSFGVTVGSGNAVIVGPDGTVQFYLQDPREIDSKFAIKIMDRIAGLK